MCVIIGQKNPLGQKTLALFASLWCQIIYSLLTIKIWITDSCSTSEQIKRGATIFKEDL
jgi:hypothetical protein